MKNKTLLKVFLAIFMASFMSACGGKKGMGRTSIRSASGSGGISTAGFNQKCANGQSAVGAVFDSGVMSGGTFRDRVLALVSATMDPSSFGDISGQYGASTGIDMRLRLLVNGSGQVDASQSQVQLVIYDSFVGQTNNATGSVINPYPITLTGSAVGSVNQATRQFQVTFSDQYGSIRLNGTWNDTQATGVVDFQNTQHYSGGAPASGTLGSFVFPTCALFN